MKTPLTEYWKLLETMEDYLRDGIRTEHPEPPPLGTGSSCEETETPELQAGEGVSAPSAEPAAVFSGYSAGAEGRTERLRNSGNGDSLEKIAREVAACRACALAETRNNPVPGEGSGDRPLVMLIGEAPGGDEDRTGHPFVGKAGQYLDKWLDSIGLDRKTNCFIGNIIKCRPPGNRDPLPGETFACRPFLDRQIDLIKPRTILTLGRISAQILINSQDGIGRLRGRTYEYRGIPLFPTYHPSGVLRNPQYRKGTWEDLQRLKAYLDTLE